MSRIIDIGDMSKSDFFKLKKIIEYAASSISRKEAGMSSADDKVLDFIIQYGVTHEDTKRILWNIEYILMNNREVFLND